MAKNLELNIPLVNDESYFCICMCSIKNVEKSQLDIFLLF